MFVVVCSKEKRKMKWVIRVRGSFVLIVGGGLGAQNGVFNVVG